MGASPQPGRPHAARANIHDVAAAAGVSSATVSRVLNHKESVKPELAERVRAAVEATGYVPNPVGRALRQRFTPQWAMILPAVGPDFFPSIIIAVEQVANELDITVTVSNTDDRLDRERRAIATTLASQRAGVLLAAASETDTDVAPLLDAGIPLVLVDRRVAGFEGDSVRTDNRALGRIAAEHLFERGYRKIGCLAGPPHVSATTDRLSGFRDALAALGAPLNPGRVHWSELKRECGEAAAAALLDSGEEFDAVFAVTSPQTMGLYRVAQLRGIDVPGRLAIMGTDDDPWASIVSPAVTMMVQPVAEIGRTAATMLAARGAGRAEPAGQVILPPLLAIREST
ncbi:MAG: LacI family transcriptional regulator [Bifidobacteriaceae bacterium]|jgi:DNA-binding LacI/PurR family transcriptional regulator|nr:LacI family transcriptional regulator [Bifidobacteriaceae bacterium]